MYAIIRTAYPLHKAPMRNFRVGVFSWAYARIYESEVLEMLGKKFGVYNVDIGDCCVKKFRNCNDAIRFAYAELEPEGVAWYVLNEDTGDLMAHS